MRIAIVVPAFNVAAFLGETIRSVVAQTYTNWSLIIVNDGSADDTAEVAAGFADPRVVLLHQKQQGVSAARNRGIRRADYMGPDAFLFLDGDDWLAPDALAVLAATLDESPGAVAAVGRYARVGFDNSPRLSSTAAAGALLEPMLIQN